MSVLIQPATTDVVVLAEELWTSFLGTDEPLPPDLASMATELKRLVGQFQY